MVRRSAAHYCRPDAAVWRILRSPRCSDLPDPAGIGSALKPGPRGPAPVIYNIKIISGLFRKKGGVTYIWAMLKMNDIKNLLQHNKITEFVKLSKLTPRDIADFANRNSKWAARLFQALDPKHAAKAFKLL